MNDEARQGKERKALLPEEQHAAPIISAVKAVSEQVGRSMAATADHEVVQ
jgi:hypothetical protein